MLENPKYGERVGKLYDIFLDRPIPDLDEAEFYVTRVIRSKNQPLFFRRKGTEMSLVEYCDIDLLVIILVLMALLATN